MLLNIAYCVDLCESIKKLQVKYSLVQNKWYNYSITISSTQQYTCTEMNDIGFT